MKRTLTILKLETEGYYYYQPKNEGDEWIFRHLTNSGSVVVTQDRIEEFIYMAELHNVEIIIKEK